MNTPSPQNPGLSNWLLISVLGLIWGGAFMSVRMSLDGFGPWTVAAARTSMAALLLIAMGTYFGQGLRTIPSLRAWKFAAIIGAFALALPFVLLTQGQQYVPSAFAGVAMGAGPLLVVLLVYVFSPDEGIGPRRIMGMILGFIGLYILIGPGAAESTGSENESLGRLACLGAACCYAVGSVVTRRAPKMPPIAFAAATMVVAAAILLPIGLIIEGVPTSFPKTPTLALIYVAIMPTAMAAIIRVQVITTAGSVFMSLTSYMVPVWSVILGVTFLSEDLPPQLFVALGFILSGIALSQSRALTAMFKR